MLSAFPRTLHYPLLSCPQGRPLSLVADTFNILPCHRSGTRLFPYREMVSLYGFPRSFPLPPYPSLQRYLSATLPPPFAQALFRSLLNSLRAFDAKLISKLLVVPPPVIPRYISGISDKRIGQERSADR